MTKYAIVTVAVLAGLFAVSRSNFLLFHGLAELFSIAVAWSVFLLVWNTKRFARNDALLFLGIAYLFIGLIDLVHTLAYKGMGVFPDIQTANLATQLWIAARGMEALSLLLFPVILGRCIRAWPVFGGYACATALLGAIFAWRLFPTCYVEGVGLTAFKKGAEYVICLTLVGAIALLGRKREQLDGIVFRLMIAAMAVTIAAELAFTFYVSVYGLSNVAGHFMKIISFFLIYLALVRSSLTQPCATLFRELEQEKAALRESQGRFKGMFDNMSSGVAIYDAVDDGENFVFVAFNSAGERIDKVARKDVIGKRVTEVFPGIVEFGLFDVFRRVWRTGEAGHHPVAFYKDERITGWRENYVYRLTSGELVSIYDDITDRKRAEQEHRRAGEFMQTVIDGSPESLMVINRDHTIALANRIVREMAGGKDPVAAGLTCHQISHKSATPCACDEHRCPMKDVIETRATVMVEHIHYDARGREVYVEIIAAPIFDEQGEVVQIIESARDITKRKRTEEERLSLERQVQHAQKLESLGVLAGGIAHDFNNLLMAILGNADLALDQLSPHAPARENIKEIEKASKRAAELARQMLAYSGKGQFVIEPINLNEFVEEMAHLLEVSISKRVVLKYNFADNLPTFDGDASQIRQIIMNLITNASEAIGDKSGVIALSTGAMDCDRAYLNSVNEILRAGLDEPLPEGAYTCLEVADTGCGMDKATIEKIFDPFFTTKFAGRGLGMSAVLGIVRGHKGAIKIYSEVGKGTTFKLLFPANELSENSAAARKSDEGAAKDWQGKGTILIADDEETVCAVGKQMLIRMGFDVLTAPDGREALKLFREHADEIVCVLLDLTMPHMNGEEAFREMRRVRSDVTVILCSGYNEQDATQRFAGKGLASFLQKPYNMAALKEKLVEVLP